MNRIALMTILHCKKIKSHTIYLFIEARGWRPGPGYRMPADHLSVTRFADAHSSSQRPAIDWQHSSSQLPVTIMTPTGSSPGGRFA